jgi:hypothetical protein
MARAVAEREPRFRYTVTPRGAECRWDALLAGQCRGCGNPVRFWSGRWWDSPSRYHLCDREVAA